jgi:hypothetical protein
LFFSSSPDLRQDFIVFRFGKLAAGRTDHSTLAAPESSAISPNQETFEIAEFANRRETGVEAISGAAWDSREALLHPPLEL